MKVLGFEFRHSTHWATSPVNKIEPLNWRAGQGMGGRGFSWRVYSLTIVYALWWEGGTVTLQNGWAARTRVIAPPPSPTPLSPPCPSQHSHTHTHTPSPFHPPTLPFFYVFAHFTYIASLSPWPFDEVADTTRKLHAYTQFQQMALPTARSQSKHCMQRSPEFHLDQLSRRRRR